ncbi:MULTISPECIES: hypothetical protein [unclassified Streptomyces]|uniref:Uncharacterized protein n=1 Tax=Streptomyces sp. NBC_00060 TaxID=2975636 RepID=A0AAU2H399_9ACTN
MPDITAAIAPLTSMGAIVGAVIVTAIAHPDPLVRLRARQVLEIIFTRRGNS